MQERICGNEFRTTLICVDSYEQGVPEGRFYNPSCPGGVGFGSLIQLLSKMEDLLDQMRFPQSYTVVRAFSAAPAPWDAQPGAEKRSQKGRLATFSVRVLFRQNASWQGTVSWLEGGREENFRSVLELVLLMDSAMHSG